MKAHYATCDDCGWNGGPYRSQPQAEYSASRHSCTKHRAKQAAAARGAARRAAVDRTPKPCHHKHATHKHGTYACYILDRCRCHPCAKANTDYERNRTRRNAYGRSRLVDAEPARAHVLHLMSQGMGLKRITAVSGVHSGTIWKLVYGKTKADGTRTPTRRVLRTTQAKILATTPDLADGARVDATGTRRRLQALGTLGWSIERIAQHIGRERQALDRILDGGDTTRKTADALAAFYDQHWDTPPTPADRHDAAGIARVRNRAKALGWAPPLAWDDERLDDPDATPALVDVTRHANGKPDRLSAVIEDVEWLLRAGVALAVIPGRVGYANPRDLSRVLHRAGRGDLATHFGRRSAV